MVQLLKLGSQPKRQDRLWESIPLCCTHGLGHRTCSKQSTCWHKVLPPLFPPPAPTTPASPLCVSIPHSEQLSVTGLFPVSAKARQGSMSQGDPDGPQLMALSELYPAGFPSLASDHVQLTILYSLSSLNPFSCPHLTGIPVLSGSTSAF